MIRSILGNTITDKEFEFMFIHRPRLVIIYNRIYLAARNSFFNFINYRPISEAISHRVPTVMRL